MEENELNQYTKILEQIEYLKTIAQRAQSALIWSEPKLPEYLKYYN